MMGTKRSIQKRGGQGRNLVHLFRRPIVPAHRLAPFVMVENRGDFSKRDEWWFENPSFCTSQRVVFNQNASIKPLKVVQIIPQTPVSIPPTFKWFVYQFR